MHTIRNIFLLVSIFLITIVSHTAAESTSYNFSVSIHTGIIYGQSEEIVYKYPAGYEYYSQLLWDLKPLAYAGFTAAFGPSDPFRQHGFIITGSAAFGLPLKTGVMEDRDWLNNYNQNLTNYSRHDAYSQNAIYADVSGGYSWRLTGSFALGVGGVFSYMLLSWMAEDGYIQYLTRDEISNGMLWNESIPKVEVFGPGIRYTQNWFIFSPDLSLKAKLSNVIFIQINAGYSPLIYCINRDDHLLTKMIFWDLLPFGHYINGGGEISFFPSGSLSLSLSVSYRYITGVRGQSYQRSTAIDSADHDYKSLGNSGGAGYSALNARFAVRFIIPK